MSEKRGLREPDWDSYFRFLGIGGNMVEKEFGICDRVSDPHEKYTDSDALCINWRPLDKTVEVVENTKNSFGVWIGGIFRPVDLGALVKILEVKDAAMEELKKENLRLQSEVQKLVFSVDNEREIGKQMGRCFKDERDKAANAQMFGVSCVCTWQAGKVTNLCGAHAVVVSEAIGSAKKSERDNLAEKFRKLTESI
jgi:hypothetical protein